MLRGLGWIYSIMMFLSFLMISKRDIPKNDANETNFLAINDENESFIIQDDIDVKLKRPPPPLKHLSFSESLKNSTFWYLSLMNLFSLTFSSFMKPQMKNFG